MKGSNIQTERDPENRSGGHAGGSKHSHSPHSLELNDDPKYQSLLSANAFKKLEQN